MNIRQVSVQEFLNKHTGIVIGGIEKVVEDSGFKAYIDTDKIRITLENQKVVDAPIFKGECLDIETKNLTLIDTK